MSVEKVKALFPKELADLLAFEQKDKDIIIKPRQFLGTDNFAKIAEIVKGAGGDYVRAGKDSHFKIPTTPAPASKQPPQQPPANLHFKVTKLTVHLGRTVQQGEEQWNKQTYGLEVEVNSDQLDIVEKAKLEAASLVSSWLTETAGQPTSEFIPQIDIGELNEAPWQTFQKKPAKPGQAAWVKNPVEFSSWKDPPNALLQLVKAMKRTSDEKLVLGNMEYAFSGEKKQFVNRKPKKTESAK